MSIELKTVMGQMNVVRGRWVSKTPNALAVREPTSRLRTAHPKGDLFVTLELRGDYEESGRDQLSQSLAETIRNIFYQSSGSITASLRLALLKAHERLLAEYAQRPVKEPAAEESSSRAGRNGWLGGVTAVAVRGEDVFIASVGPAITYTVTRGIVTQFPEASPWLDMADPLATGAPALGRWTGLDVQLFHVQVEPGDMLVLGDSRFAARTSADQIEKAVAYQGVEGALTNLGKLTGGHDCTALVVEIQAKSKDSQVQEKAAAPDHTLHPRQTVSVKPVATPDATLPANLSHTSARDGAALREVEGGLSGKVSRPRIQVPVGRWLAALGKGLLALLMVISAGLRTLISRVLPGQGHPAPARQAVTTGQAHRIRTSRFPQRILRTIALALPIVVILVVALTYWQRGLARENEFNGLMEQAQTTYQQAVNADDATARELLAQTEGLLGQAEAIKPDEPVIGELRGSIAEHLDKIGRVERLYWVGQLRTYEDPGTQLRRIIVNGLDVYVLDAGADRVYRHQLDEVNDALKPDEGDPILAQRGQQVGTSVVGEMIDLVWMPAGGNRQTSDLLILESGGLLEYNPSWGLTAVPIANKESWILPTSIGGYFGNFYVLDSQAGQILRYLPTTEDYTAPAENYFPENAVDLSGAVDIAIDGFVYVLYADGTIRKYEGGVPVAFEITELDKPLSRPMAIYTATDDVAQYIYVADAGNRRVVQLNKDGRFARQFKPRDEEGVDFSTLRSIFVDELTGKLYLLNDHALYIANITPLSNNQ
jgi:hypothetical protein